MLSFLDKVVAEEEKKLSDFKEDYYKLDFNYVGYSNAQVCFSLIFAITQLWVADKNMLLTSTFLLRFSSFNCRA